jgi:hypothetical protein
MKTVATMTLRCIRPNHDPQIVVVSVGEPYENGSGGWACTVALQGLYARLADIHGADSLQALCLALTLVRDLLEDVLERGGHFLDPQDGAPVELKSYFGRIGDSA